MGETKQTEQGTPSAKEAPPGGSEGTTPKETPPTYTQDQVDKAVQAALTKAGRTEKSFSTREATIKAREDALAEKERQKEAAELEEAKKDPDALAAYNAKQARKQQEADLKKEREQLERDKAEHEAEIIAAKEAQKEITIWQVASAKKIDPEKLKELSEELNIEVKEKLERLADEIAAKPGGIIDPDSGLTKGATPMPESAKGKIKAGWAEVHK